MIVLLASLAFADDMVFVVEQGEEVTITGPSVWMGEERYRRYVADSRKLPECQEKLDMAINLSIAANERALRARDVAKAEFSLANAEDAEQVQTIATQAVRIDALAGKVDRLKGQRNVAWGIAGGFIAASTAATVLTLSK